ncbi:hypothetical protein ACNOYE_35465 [Nannocystaceae bacterium ST9]
MKKKKLESIEFATVRLAHKTVVLMKDDAEPTEEMSGARAQNADTMYWARCMVDGQPEVVTREAEYIRAFVGEEATSLDPEQTWNLATVICYLLKLGHAVGGPFGPPERIADAFRVSIESVTPKLVEGWLIFFAHVLSPDDLFGVLHEYEYDLRTGSVRHLKCIQPYPIWEVD